MSGVKPRQHIWVEKRMMRKNGHYDIADSPEYQFEPGSDDQVLMNLLGITSRADMELIETRELMCAAERLTEEYDRDHSFTAADICAMHRLWLGSIYPWAGCYRQVYLSKDGFPFAAPAHIPLLMAGLEENVLCRYTPCTFAARHELVEVLALVHCELLLVHPFRDGNGRIARLLAMLMALQAGLPPLDFSELAQQKRDAYLAALHCGQELEYGPLEEIFRGVIVRSERSAALPF